MPVPSTIDDLSTTASSNSPAGSEGPQEGDNYIRALSSFIALLRDKLNGTSNTGTIKNGTFSGTMAGAASWAALQTFAAGIAGTDGAFSGDVTVGDDITATGDVNAGGNVVAAGNMVATGTLAAGNIAGTTWTPTLTAVANVASVVDNPACHYLRVTSSVTVSGQFTISLTAGSSTLTRLGISLPVASSFSSLQNAAGIAVCVAATDGNEVGWITGDATNDRLEFVFYAPSTTTRTFKFHATYRII